MILRGQVREFIEKDGTSDKKALVISDNDRVRTKTASVLVTRQYSSGNTMASFTIDGEEYFVNCHMVTYCTVDRLGDLVGEVENMDEIDDKIMKALGLWKYKGAYEILKDYVRGKEEK